MFYFEYDVANITYIPALAFMFTYIDEAEFVCMFVAFGKLLIIIQYKDK